MGFDPASFAIGKASGGGGGGGGKLQKKTFTTTDIRLLLQGPIPFSIGPDAGYDGLSEVEVILPDTFDLISESTSIAGRAQYNNPNTKTYTNYKTNRESNEQFYYEQDGNTPSGFHIYGPRSANNTAMFNVAIPKTYNLLSIDIEGSGNTGAYNLSSMYLRDAFGVTGYNGGQFAGNYLKTVEFIAYGKTAQQINSQPGVTIDTQSPYTLKRQTVLVDISGFDVDLWIGWHRCDNTTTIYSIIASK